MLRMSFVNLIRTCETGGSTAFKHIFYLNRNVRCGFAGGTETVLVII